MSTYLVLILVYLVALGVFNFIRARRIRSQEDFMVAGRSLSVTKMVFTLICTWIGSGTFIAGAEYAANAGWSSLWLPAGAWVGIAVIYFLAARIRGFGQYTVGDILEVRYGKFARLFGALAIVIAFTTIVSYQFRAGGLILNTLTDGRVSVEWGQFLAFLFVTSFTAIGGMVAVAHTDLPNGIIIVLACILATPLMILIAGGPGAAAQILPADHFMLFAPTFGERPALEAGSTFIATLLLLMGIQSMYQKFYSAKSPAEARKAVSLWIVGTVVVETVVVVIAIYSAAHHWPQVEAYRVAARVQEQVATGRLAPEAAHARALELARESAQKGTIRPGQAAALEAELQPLAAATTMEAVRGTRLGIAPAAVVLQAGKDMAQRGGILGSVIGLLLLGAACAVVISTGMNYLLSPSTNLIRDIYQRFIRPDADQKTVVALQKVFIAVLGLFAFLAMWIPTYFGLQISVLKYSIFAYTIYGVAITPALLAALAWPRATRAGGLASIVGGSIAGVFFEVVRPFGIPPVYPAGIPSVYPAALISIGALVVVSLLTTPPSEEDLAQIFKKA